MPLRRRRPDPDRDATLFDRFAVAFFCALVGGLLACVLFVVVAVVTGDYAARPAAFVFPIGAMALAGAVLGPLAVDSVLLCLAVIAGLLAAAISGPVGMNSLSGVDRGEGPEKPLLAGLYVLFVVAGTLALLLAGA